MSYSVLSDFDFTRNQYFFRLLGLDPMTRNPLGAEWKWVPIEPGEKLPDGVIQHYHLDDLKSLLQAFMDEAWRIGLKPTSWDKKMTIRS